MSDNRSYHAFHLESVNRVTNDVSQFGPTVAVGLQLDGTELTFFVRSDMDRRKLADAFLAMSKDLSAARCDGVTAIG